MLMNKLPVKLDIKSKENNSTELLFRQCQGQGGGPVGPKEIKVTLSCAKAISRLFPSCSHV